MKLRHPKLIAGAARAVTLALRGVMQTSSVALRPLADYVSNDRPALIGDARHIYAFWHEHLLAMGYAFAWPDISVMIGNHADGELIAHVVQQFDAGVVRGSTSRGGARALLHMIRHGTRHLAITPDGPRGPRRECQKGVAFLASATGMPVVPVGLGYRRAWRAGSWDRMAVPMPFGRVRVVTGPPIVVPPGLRSADLETHRRDLERMLNLTCDIAEHWAETGEFDPLGYTPPAGWAPAGRRQFASTRQKPYSPST